MANSNINIQSVNGTLVKNSTVYASSPTLSSGSMNISLHIEDTSQNIEDAILNINPNNIQLLLYGSEDYDKQASLYFGRLFSGGFNAEYMWDLLAASTTEQINSSHLVQALAPTVSQLTSLADALHIHIIDNSRHLSSSDRDFLTRLEAIYGSEYNVTLDYLILRNPYTGEINITNSELALYAGEGGFSAYGSAVELETEFYNLIQPTIPTKSGGYHTAEAFFAQNNTYGYGITTLTIPTTAPEDLIQGETGLYLGIGGFSAHVDLGDGQVVRGYYYEDKFYSDSDHQNELVGDEDMLYIDLISNRMYVFDSVQGRYIQITADAGIVEGYYNQNNGKFYTTYVDGIYSDEITGSSGVLYLDKTTNTLYRYDSLNHAFAQISGSGGSQQGNSIVFGYLNNSIFYSERSGSYGSYEYSLPVAPDEISIYVDRATSEVYKYSNSSYVKYTSKVSLTQTPRIIITQTGDNAWTFAHKQLANAINNTDITSTAPSYGHIISRIYYDSDALNNQYYGHVTQTEALKYNTLAEAKTIVRRTLTDAAIKAQYFIVSNNTSVTEALGQNESAIFIGEGGFTSTSAGDVNEYYAGTGLLLNSLTNTFSVNLGYTPASGSNNYPVQADLSGKLYVYVPFSSWQDLTVSDESDTIGTSGTLMKSLTLEYNGILKRKTINYDSARTASTIVERRGDASIAANYIALANSNSSFSNLALNEIALFFGEGAFNSVSAGDNYYMYDSIVNPLIQDSVYSADALYTEINRMWTAINNASGGTTYEWTHTFPINIDTQGNTKTISIAQLTASQPVANTVLTGISVNSTNPTYSINTNTIGYSILSTASLLVQRGADSSVNASYYILNASLTNEPIVAEDKVALYNGTGGFDAQSAGREGTMDHNELSNRFSTSWDSGVSYQHDIGAIAGLQAALDAAAATGGIASINAPSPLHWTSNTSTLTIDSISINSTSGTLGASGNVLSSATMAQNTWGLIQTQYIPYNQAAVASTLAARRADSSLVASYLNVINNYSGTFNLDSNESALYIGSGGFDSVSSGPEYSAGEGLSLDSNNVFSINLGYQPQTGSANYAVQADPTTHKLFVNVPGGGSGGGGTLSSVGLSMPNGFTVNNTPLTQDGTITVSLNEGYTIPQTTDLLTQNNKNVLNLLEVGTKNNRQHLIIKENLWLDNGKMATFNSNVYINGPLTLSGEFNFAGEILYSSNNNSKLGSTNYPWKNVYGEHFYKVTKENNNPIVTEILPQVQADWNQTDTRQRDFIKNKPQNLIDTNTWRPISLYEDEDNDFVQKQSEGIGTGNLKLKAGSNMTISYDTANNSFEFSSTDTNTHYISALRLTAGGTSIDVLEANTPNPYLAILEGADLNNLILGNKLHISGSGSVSVVGNGANLTIGGTDTWIPMVGATSEGNGSVGYVNAIPPQDGYNTKYLRADGTWTVPPDTQYNAAEVGTLGLIKINQKRIAQALDPIDLYQKSPLSGADTQRYYGVEIDTNGKAYVYVPWVSGGESSTVEVESLNPTASWNDTITVGTVNDVNLQFTMPENPNIDTDTTYKLILNGNEEGDSGGTSLGTFYAPISAGTSGQFLISNGSGAPSWQSRIGASNLPTGNSGTVLIGNGSSTNPSFSANPTVNSILIGSSSPVTISKTSSGLSINNSVTLTSGKFYDSSDIRLKRKIKELTSVLDCMEDIPIVQYEYKSQEDVKYIGTLAQKLLPLFPELVSQDGNGYYSVDYGGLAALTLQGLKELYKRVKYLEEKIYGDI